MATATAKAVATTNTIAVGYLNGGSQTIKVQNKSTAATGFLLIDPNELKTIPSVSTINSVKLYYSGRVRTSLDDGGFRVAPYAIDAYSITGNTFTYSGAHATKSLTNGKTFSSSSYSDDVIDLGTWTSEQVRNGMMLGAGFFTENTVTSCEVTVTNLRVIVDYTVPSYYLDLNGMLDGASSGSISPYGTADVYINGSLVSQGVGDFWQSYEYGTTYEIKNIKANDGYQYDGVYSGSLSGTITETTNVVLSFSTKKTNKIYVGTSQPKSIYVGTSEVKAVYVGTTKIYG